MRSARLRSIVKSGLPFQHSFHPLTPSLSSASCFLFAMFTPVFVVTEESGRKA